MLLTVHHCPLPQRKLYKKDPNVRCVFQGSKWNYGRWIQKAAAADPVVEDYSFSIRSPAREGIMSS
ncbi:hypothetical protein AMELA_G00000670 [Ameiurus melas]|uniref:Uncharacterized protein n=1 Tax=Ameiurus melas TaxID=219545 RepID=A0A7J6BDZ6_AMEME|nr:hypothetical protein AMELA_G00000670 [Ameiurus melas]